MARVIFLTDFSEAYARELLLGMARYAHDTAQAWSLCRLPLSIRDKFGIEAVVEWAVRMKADAVIGQFYNTDNVGLFRENGIIAIAQDFKKRFTTIPNITGPHHLAGRMAAEYFLKKGFRNFAFYGRGASTSRTNAARVSARPSNGKPRFHLLVTAQRRPERPVVLRHGAAHHMAAIAAQTGGHHGLRRQPGVPYHRGVPPDRGGGIPRIPNDIAILGVDNDETICKLSAPNLSSLSQGVEQGGYDVARLIDRLIRNPEAEWEDVMVMPLNIITRQSTDIYANNDPHIAEVLRYIHENISQKITVDDLVKLVPLSRRLLETRFKKSMGTSIYDYIIQTRIEKMMQLLCEGLSVSEAAAELGFSDIKNVSRTFRQLKGITPSEYREQVAPKRR